MFVCVDPANADAGNELGEKAPARARMSKGRGGSFEHIAHSPSHGRSFILGGRGRERDEKKGSCVSSSHIAAVCAWLFDLDRTVMRDRIKTIQYPLYLGTSGRPTGRYRMILHAWCVWPSDPVFAAPSYQLIFRLLLRIRRTVNSKIYRARANATVGTQNLGE